MKKAILILGLFIIRINLFGQNPIPNETQPYQGTRYVLDTNAQGNRDTIVFHIYYLDVGVNVEGVSSHLKVYKIQREDGVWDTTIGYTNVFLSKNNTRYAGYHNYFWNLDTKDTANKYINRYIEDKRPYLKAR